MDHANKGGEALAYLQDPRWKASRLGLDRTLALLGRMGNPERRLKFVHVTGTNGKGSTASMIASVLTEAGYRTGLFTSPCLERINEQIQVDRLPISSSGLEEAAAFAARFAAQMPDHPTEFEMLVCAALAYFARKGCEIVVLEVGMGGLRDATNVIPPPEVAVITAVSLDHTGILGDTVEKIAAEKAGIIKPGCEVVLSRQPAEVTQVVQQACHQQGCALRVADARALLEEPHMTLEGLDFLYQNERLSLPLLGRHQLENAATALTALEALQARGWRIPSGAISCGLTKVSWPGRLEILSTDPFFLLDGAHNPQGAQTVAGTLAELFPGQRFLFVAGVLADKDWRQILSPVLSMARAFVTVTPENPRALPGEELAEALRRLGYPAENRATIREGVGLAFSLALPGEPICAFGSLYQAGAVRAAVFGHSRPPLADGNDR